MPWAARGIRLIEKLKRFATEKKIGISLPEPIPIPSRSI